MDAILNINSSAAAFSDQALTNNPKRKFFDWTRNSNGLAVKNPKSNGYTLAAGETRAIFSGTRTTTIGANTAWSVAAKSASTYRFTWVGGTAPGLRTQRDMNWGPYVITVVVNNNSTVTMTSQSASPFNLVSTGDIVYIPTPADATSPFNPANTGFWTVLGQAGGNQLTLARPVADTFDGVSETVTVTNTNVTGPILVFTPTGVMAGDMVDVTAGFMLPTQRTFQINKVTCNWFEVSSVAPLPPEATVVAGVSALTFYNQAKSFMRIETDQPIALTINGASALRVNPFSASDQNYVGWFENVGSVWSLSITNRSSYDASVSIFSAE